MIQIFIIVRIFALFKEQAKQFIDLKSIRTLFISFLKVYRALRGGQGLCTYWSETGQLLSFSLGFLFH